MLKIVIQPFVGLVLSESVDETGGTVHGPKLIYVVRDGYNGKEYTYAAEDCRAVEAPACCWAEFDAPPAERLYAAYNRAGGDARIGVTWNGQPVPSWRDLQARAAAMDAGAEGVLAKWSATAEFAIHYLPPRHVPKMDEMDIGQALGILNIGGRICRAGWNGKGMWLEKQVPDEHSKMTEPYTYMRTAQGGLIPWLCSQADFYAKDWMQVPKGGG